MTAVTRLNAALQGRYRIEREIGEGGMATVYLTAYRLNGMGSRDRWISQPFSGSSCRMPEHRDPETGAGGAIA